MTLVPTLFEALLRPGQAQSTPLSDLLEHAAQAPFEPADSGSVNAALQAGHGAATLGQAFATGYVAALRRLAPLSTSAGPPALCVTESAGNGPRAMRTTLAAAGEAYILSGEKSFVTFGTLAKRLLVAATAGIGESGLPTIVMVAIPTHREGVSVTALPTLPFLPDVPHASVRFDNVQVSPEERLPGDGYLRYVKPFRTIEDIHVMAAVTGHLLGLLAEQKAPREVLEDGAGLAAMLVQAGTMEPLSAGAHLLLACILRQTRAFVGQALEDLKGLAEGVLAHLTRDLAVLKIAEGARLKRREKAWASLGR